MCLIFGAKGRSDYSMNKLLRSAAGGADLDLRRRLIGGYPGEVSTGAKTAVKWRSAAGSDTIR